MVIPKFSGIDDTTALVRELSWLLRHLDQDNITQYVTYNEEVFFDASGINPDFIKRFPNKIINSGFERFRPGETSPMYWTGDGVVTADSNFDGTYSLQLEPGEYIEQGILDDGVTSAGPDPDWWSAQQTRAAFKHKGGAVRVKVLLVSDDSTHTLTDNSDEDNEVSGSYIDYSAVENWEDGHHTFYFQPEAGAGRVKLRFENVDPTDSLYLDSIQMEPDFTGKWPSIYTYGPRSFPLEDIASPVPATVVVAASNSRDTNRADFVCDGVDDEVEIQAAVDALGTNGGSVVLLDGDFYFGSAEDGTTPVSVESEDMHVAIKGQGPGQTRLQHHSEHSPYWSNAIVVDNGEGSFFVLEDLSIYDMTVYVTDGGHCTFRNLYGHLGIEGWIPVIQVDEADNVTMSDCTFEGYEDGAWIVGGNLYREGHARVANCLFRTESRSGNPSLLVDNLRATITNCIFTGPGDDNEDSWPEALYVSCGGEGSVVSNCIFEHWGHGIAMTWNTEVTNCSFYSCTHAVWSLSGVSLHGGHGINLSNLKIRDSAHHAMLIEDTQEVHIRDCIITGTGTAAVDTYSHIKLTDETENVTVQGCVFRKRGAETLHCIEIDADCLDTWIGANDFRDGSTGAAVNDNGTDTDTATLPNKS